MDGGVLVVAHADQAGEETGAERDAPESTDDGGAPPEDPDEDFDAAAQNADDTETDASDPTPRGVLKVTQAEAQRVTATVLSTQQPACVHT